jgi:tetratricopeptide (TPR) repeat protein
MLGVISHEFVGGLRLSAREQDMLATMGIRAYSLPGELGRCAAATAVLCCVVTAPSFGQFRLDDPLAPYLTLVENYRRHGMETLRAELTIWPIDRVEALGPLLEVASRETVAVQALVVPARSRDALKGYPKGTVYRIDDPVYFRAAAMMELERAVDEAFAAGKLDSVPRHIEFGRWVLQLAPRSASESEPAFSRLWYRAVVFFLSGLASPAGMEQVLTDAEQLFPFDDEIKLSRGAQLELLATPPFNAALLPVGQLTRPERQQRMELRTARLLDDARRAYEAAVEMNPANAEGWIRLGFLRLRRGDVEGAAAASHAPRASDAPWLRYMAAMLTAAVCSRREDWDGAAAAYRQAIGVVPGAQSAMIGLSEALIRSGRGRESAAALDGLFSAPRHGARTDPWWDYAAGPAWRLMDVIDTLRSRIRP